MEDLEDEEEEYEEKDYEGFGSLVKDRAIIGAKTTMGIVQIVVTCWVLSATNDERRTFLHHIPLNSTVYTVQRYHYWAPVHALVPFDCKDLNWTTDKDQTGENRRLEEVPAKLCNGDTKIFYDYTWKQTWLAGVWMRTGDKATVEGIIDTRRRLFGFLGFALVIVVLTFVCVNISTSLTRSTIRMRMLRAGLRGHTGLGDEDNHESCGHCCITMSCKLLNIEFHKTAILVHQLTILALYCAFNSGGYITMIYVPGMLYVLMMVMIFWTICAFGLAYYDLEIIALPCGGLFGISFVCFFLPFVIIPIFAYCLYLMQFLWTDHTADIISAESNFGVKWPGETDWILDLSKVCFLVNFIDACVDFGLEFL